MLGLLSALAVSCVALDDDGGTPQEGIVVPARLSCELLETETGEVGVKSMHDASVLRKISNANYYLFKDGCLVGQEYFADAEDFAVTLPSKTEEYRLYVLANVGEKTVGMDTAESDMGTAVHQDYGGYGDYFRTIGDYGFPMSAIFGKFTAETAGDLVLRRLVHTLYVTADTGGLGAAEMTVTGLTVRNAARDVYPFAAESRADHVMTGDAANLDAEDLDIINRGGKVALYLLENMRGELFPDNSDWKKKVPSNMNPKSEKDYASYIELTAEVRTPTAHYARNVYRAYLGTSPADCNVRRHTYFELRNRFTDTAIVDDDWRIETDVPVINGALAFVDTRYTSLTAPNKTAVGDVSNRAFREVDAFYTMDGFIALYYIYRSDPGIGYTLTMEPNNDGSQDCADFVKYEMREVDENFTALIIRTECPVSDNGERHRTDPSYSSGKSVLFRVRSNDGLVGDEMVCRVLEHPLAVRFRYEGVSSSNKSMEENGNGRFNMYFTNPLGLYVGVHIGGTVYGRLTHSPNGGIGGDKKKEYEVEVNTGNRHRDGETVPTVEANSRKTFNVIPQTGKAVRIDMYKPEMVYGSGTFYRSADGFHEYFLDIWNNTAWHDWTWLGTSGADKHAEPYKVELDMDIRYLSPNPNRLLPYDSIPVHVENADSGTDMGFIFHHVNITDFTKTVTFDSADEISVSVNGRKSWGANTVKVTRNKNFGTLSDYDILVMEMIGHRLDNSL